MTIADLDRLRQLDWIGVPKSDCGCSAMRGCRALSQLCRRGLEPQIFGPCPFFCGLVSIASGRTEHLGTNGCSLLPSFDSEGLGGSVCADRCASEGCDSCRVPRCRRMNTLSPRFLVRHALGWRRPVRDRPTGAAAPAPPEPARPAEISAGSAERARTGGGDVFRKLLATREVAGNRRASSLIAWLEEARLR
jgi:hypothetical protein